MGQFGGEEWAVLARGGGGGERRWGRLRGVVGRHYSSHIRGMKAKMWGVGMVVRGITVVTVNRGVVGVMVGVRGVVGVWVTQILAR